MAGLVGFLLWVVEYGLFFGLPIVILVLIYVFWITSNYFFEIVEFRTLGHQGWPVFSLETLIGGRNQVGVLYGALVLAVAGSCFGLRYFGMETSARVVLGAGLVVLPGSVALLAVTREVSAALNPLRVLSASILMGHGYLWCLMAATVIVLLIATAERRGGMQWYFPLIYALFLHAYLIGAVVYTRRTVLGVVAPKSPEAQAERAKAQAVATRHGILTHAYGFATHGNLAGALKHIDQYIATEENTTEARLWMLSEMMRWQDSDAGLVYGERLIAHCEERGLASEAARVRLQCDYLRERRDLA